MRRERGSASIVAVAVLALVVLIGVGVAAVAGFATDRAAARAAADLAALAGAYEARAELAGKGGEPCAVARRTAAENGAVVTGCHVFGDGSVQVSVASGKGTASARAGPQK